MVKGVNKSVIEISDTGNKFFNKVILFVSPEYAQKSDKQLTTEADEFVKRLQGCPRESLRKAIIRERKRRRRLFLCFTVGFLIIFGIVLWLIL